MYKAIGDCLCLDKKGIKLFEAKGKTEVECSNLPDPPGFTCYNHKWKHAECFLYKETPAVQLFNNSSDSKDCSAKCDNQEYCRYSSWNNRTCTLLKLFSDFTENAKDNSSKFFCQREGSIITRREILCQSVNKVQGKVIFIRL